MNYSEKIESYGLKLPSAPKPIGAYKPVIIFGNTAYLSGQIALLPNGKVIEGCLGRDLSLAEGQKAAYQCALNALSLIKDEIGFDHFRRILKVVGYVQADAEFVEISQVVNAASDLFLKIFGEEGKHARSAVGVSSLPLRSAVEIEVTVEVQ